MRIEICRVGTNETLVFAAEELRKYLYLIDETVEVDIFAYERYRAERPGGLWLVESPDGLAPKVKDARMDDAFKISIKDNTGYIAGTNPISVLIGTYSLLKKLGCAWIRPGREGEIITKSILSPLNFNYEEVASYRFRGIDGGGGPCEKLLDMVDWSAKEGMNNYFVEHLNCEDTVKGSYPELDSEDRHAAFGEVLREMKKRGLKRHAVGHGWTLLALDWDVTKKPKGPEDFTPEQLNCMALRNGVRAPYKTKFNNAQINATQLCYSQKHLRDKITDAVVDYLKSTEYVDYLHFWLADGVNNHCECEDCQKHRPSDWYVTILNELDEKLTKEGIDSRIVCLVYVDLLWEPKDFKIKNPDRFIMMFAPITRVYDTSYAIDENEKAEKTPYVRNKLVWPKTAKENILYVRDWQKNQLKGDSFVFDYHLMWNQYKDPGYRLLSRIVYEDMANLENNGFGGNISCEITSCQIPHDFPHRIMARTLWNKNVDYAKEEESFFRESFGEDWKIAFDYLSGVTDAFSIIYRYYHSSDARVEGIALGEKAEKLLSEFKPKILEAAAKDNCRAIKLSWKFLVEHTDYILPFAKSYSAKYNSDLALSDKYLEDFEAVCDSIADRYYKNFNGYYSKYSVRFYRDEIGDDGAEPLIF